MRTHITVVAALFFVLIPPLCHARLGDTMEQCVARWGAGNSSPPPHGVEMVVSVTFQTFFKYGFTFHVGFMNGVVCYEEIKKDVEPNLTGDDVTAILNAESASQQWTKQSQQTDDVDAWQRSDGATAYYYHQSKEMILTSKAFQEAYTATVNHQPF